jgi:hypothetical protein
MDNSILGLPTHPVRQKERQAREKGMLLSSCIKTNTGTILIY